MNLKAHNRNTLDNVRTFAASISVATLLVAGAASAWATVRYVDVNSSNATPPYFSWATAATNIQDAVDAAVAGDEIVVTNGIYATGGRSIDGFTANRVAVDKPLAVRSINGPQFTIIDGERSVRCVYLTNEASLSGFTLTNGLAGGDPNAIPTIAGVGGGVRCSAPSAVISNCVIAGNVARTYGSGGGAYGGTFNNCTLIGNSAVHSGFCARPCADGGGVSDCTLNNCTLTGNSPDGASASMLNNCLIITNHGGGAVGCTLNNCSLSGNSGQDGGGARGSTLSNCTLTGNSASRSGGGAAGCVLNNCTLVANSAPVGGGASYAIGDEERSLSTLNNCIIYFNTANEGANYDSSCTLNYSCTTPLPTNGVGNIANDPGFANPAAANYRLRPNSRCIDAGSNLSAIITNDLDGRPRPLDGNGDGLAAFDVGAYEYRTPLLVWQDSPNPTPPHTDWATAAHTVQDAVDAANAGDEIVVTNGIYTTGGRATVSGGLINVNRVAVDKLLSLRSVNGWQFTIIDGGQSSRCVYLTNGASLSGFTLTNGFAQGIFGGRFGGQSPGQGGGVWCESPAAILSDCVLAGNWAQGMGGGAFGGSLNHCTLMSNWAFQFRAFFGAYPGVGGGAFECVLEDCTLSGNSADFAGGTCNNSTLRGNLAAYSGGGASDSTLNNCKLNGNSAGSEFSTATAQGGGANTCTLNNCILTGNRSQKWGGGTYGCTLSNCTVAGNSANVGSNESVGGGAMNCTLNNCIIYFNTAAQGANYAGGALNYSCTTPLPSAGIGNITDAPLFVDQVSGNLRLQSNSPCINAGQNALAPAGSDLDGYPRVVGYTVDMGPYEFQLAPPQFTITTSDTNAILAWPTNYAEVVIQDDHYEAYFLYFTTNLVSPVVWRFVYPMPVVVNRRLTVTNSIDSFQRFFRIVKVTGPLQEVPCLQGGPNPRSPCYECINGVWTQFGNCRL